MKQLILAGKSVPQEEVLDGHSIHTLSVAAVAIPLERCVLMLLLPSHNTHRIQSPDVSFLKALNIYAA
jgi:hypothetical protein